MEVITLGLSRSGTESLAVALKQLGYENVWHGYNLVDQSDLYEPWVRLMRRKWGSSRGWLDGSSGGQEHADGSCKITRADFDTLIGDCAATCDAPPAMFYREMVEAYPEARVILNYREDLDAWYRSTMATLMQTRNATTMSRILAYFTSSGYWRNQVYNFVMGRFYHGDFEKHGKWVYQEHMDKVRGFVPKHNLLEWQVKDGWEPLCEFLGKEMPDEEFPSGNPPDTFLQRIAAANVERNRRAWANLITTVSAASAVVALAAYWIRKT